jgi:hypothetical protein
MVVADARRGLGLLENLCGFRILVGVATLHTEAASYLFCLLTATWSRAALRIHCRDAIGHTEVPRCDHSLVSRTNAAYLTRFRTT